MNLIVIPFHDWKKCEREGFRTRDAHLMQEFEKHPAVDKILVINRPISYAEIVLMRRNWQPQNGCLVFKSGNVAITQVSEKVFTLDIRVSEFIRPLMMRRNWTPYIFGEQSVLDAFNLAIQFLGMDVFNLFTSAPLFVPLIKKLSPRFLAFDAQDNLLKHAFYKDVPSLEEYYLYCLDHADFVSTNSKETCEWFQTRRTDAIHIPNGVDKDRFVAQRDYAVPEDVRPIGRPVVGYAGKMQEMFDLSLMVEVASAMPNVQFAFIGQQLNANWVKPLWELDNVHYLGDKQYELLPQYLASFDICTIPYNLTRQHGVDPIKFYEYMAMGKPIVTTAVGNVTSFANHPQVCIANTSEEFVRGIEMFLGSPPQMSDEDAQSLPLSILWSTKADAIISEMISHASID